MCDRGTSIPAIERRRQHRLRVTNGDFNSYAQAHMFHSVRSHGLLSCRRRIRAPWISALAGIHGGRAPHPRARSERHHRDLYCGGQCAPSRTPVRATRALGQYRWGLDNARGARAHAGVESLDVRSVRLRISTGCGRLRSGRTHAPVRLLGLSRSLRYTRCRRGDRPHVCTRRRSKRKRTAWSS